MRKGSRSLQTVFIHKILRSSLVSEGVVGTRGYFWIFFLKRNYISTSSSAFPTSPSATPAGCLWKNFVCC